MSYTPGPWINEDYPGACNPSVSGHDGANVATCGGKHRSKEEKAANADLIAAAPDLYEALKDMQAVFHQIIGCASPGSFHDINARACAALAKAVKP